MAWYQQYINLFNNVTKTNEVLKNLDNEAKRMYTLFNSWFAANGHAHTGNGSDGAIIGNVPTGNITATTMQGAVNELDSKKVAKGELVINVKNYGAKGDGIADDTTFIELAQAEGKPLYFPPGTYIISSPLPYNVPIQGSGAVYTKIKASSDFTGTMMIDFAQSTHEQQFIIGMTFDANNKNIKIFGSSSSGSAGGGSQSYFERLFFTNTPNGVYAVGGDSTTSEAGMLTGSVFNRCTWNGCSQALNIGNNQDDAVFIGCRFHMDGATTDNYFIKILGSNIKFVNSYLYLSNSNNTTFKAPIYIGANPVKFDGLFLEANSCNLQGIFFANDPSTHLSIENVIYRVISSSEVAFIRTINKDGAYYCLKNIKIHADSTTVHAIQFYCNGTEITSVFEFNGIDGFTNVINVLSTSVLTKKFIILVGVYKNKNYGNVVTFLPSSTLIYEDNFSYDSKSGLVQNYVGITNSSALSPQTYDYQLPSDGLWLVTCRAMLDGSKDHMSMGLFSAVWYSGANNVKSITMINVNATNSAYTIGTMTATISTTGLITFSLPWAAGGTHACGFEVNAIKQL